MKRRDFLRFGAVAAGTPAALSLLNVACAGDSPNTSTVRDAAGSIRISSNENPLGVTEPLRDAIVRGLDGAHQYPGASAERLAEAVAARHGTEPDGVVLGHGSTDILRMAVHSRIVREPGVRLVSAQPTFEQFERYAQPLGGRPTQVPLLEGSYAHDLDAMRAAVAGADAALIYICNPNNPTGTVTPVRDVAAWIDDAPPTHVFLVDEAYFEFVEDPAYESLDGWARERPNVIVVRTFSKIFGLAGVRVGYAIAHPETAEQMREFSVATSPNHLGNVAGMAALEDEDIVRTSLETNRAARRVVYDTLDELGLPYMESHTNFVMHAINDDVEAYRDRMRDAGILVGRAFPPFTRHNRVSLGTPDQMRRWADALYALRERGLV